MFTRISDLENNKCTTRILIQYLKYMYICASRSIYNDADIQIMVWKNHTCENRPLLWKPVTRQSVSKNRQLLPSVGYKWSWECSSQTMTPRRVGIASLLEMIRCRLIIRSGGNGMNMDLVQTRYIQPRPQQKTEPWIVIAQKPNETLCEACKYDICICSFFGGKRAGDSYTAQFCPITDKNNRGLESPMRCHLGSGMLFWEIPWRPLLHRARFFLLQINYQILIVLKTTSNGNIICGDPVTGTGNRCGNRNNWKMVTAYLINLRLFQNRRALWSRSHWCSLTITDTAWRELETYI